MRWNQSDETRNKEPTGSEPVIKWVWGHQKDKMGLVVKKMGSGPIRRLH